MRSFFLEAFLSACVLLLLSQGTVGYEVRTQFSVKGGGRVISDIIDEKRDARKIEMMFPLRDGTELHTLIFLPRTSTGSVRFHVIYTS